MGAQKKGEQPCRSHPQGLQLLRCSGRNRRAMRLRLYRGTEAKEGAALPSWKDVLARSFAHCQPITYGPREKDCLTLTNHARKCRRP